MNHSLSRLKAAMLRILIICAVPLVLMVLTLFVFAHPTSPRNAGYAALVLRPFIVLDHALCLAAAGLLAAQQKAIGVPIALSALLAGLAAGFTGIFFVPSFPGDVFLPMAGAAVLALIVVIEPALNRWLVAALVFFAGVAVGFNTYPEAPMLYVLALTLGGLMLGAGLLFTMIAWPVSLLQKDWQRIGIRIAGSWIVAIVSILLALTLRP